MELLTEARLMSQAFPSSFEVPSAARLASIAPGHVVKVCADEERFWVLVLGMHGDTIIGRVDNVLISARNRRVWSCGTIHLQRQHVLHVFDPRDRDTFCEHLLGSGVTACGDVVILAPRHTNRLSTALELAEKYAES